MGFAQKLIIKRGKSDGIAKSAVAFLQDISGQRFLLGGMMSDAATETMVLIRHLDDEKLDITMLCYLVSNYLDHITWLFFEGGVFEIDGHTTYIMKWYESSLHHYVVGSEGKCMGGKPFDHATIQTCLKHMQAWVHLVKPALEAEFPSFGVINCFSVFALPKNKPDKQVLSSPEVETKLKRLSVVFKKKGLMSQYRYYWHHAYVAFKAANFMCTYWVAWRQGIVSGGGAHDSGDVLYVVKRGQVYAPITSGVEQNFSKLAELFGTRCLNAAGSTEDRNINLALAILNDGQLNDLVKRAQQIWIECFQRHSRTAVLVRKDKDTPHAWKAAGNANENTEKNFLKRIHENIVASTTSNASSILCDHGDTGARPSAWTDSHEKELKFQHDKKRKREVDANIQGFLLPSEQTPELRQASVVEIERQSASYVSRLRTRLKYEHKTTAVPPTIAELKNARCYIDDGVVMPTKWLATLSKIHGVITRSIHVANLFVAMNPRDPQSNVITLAACLRGAWVISPAYFGGESHTGPSIKYQPSVMTKRSIWASPKFKREFPSHWLLILEILNTVRHRWSFLSTPEQWANTRVEAERKGRPTDVFALVHPSECNPAIKHAFALDQLVAFIAHADPDKGSIGLLNM